MMGHLSPNHLNNDLFGMVGFGMVGFQIPTVIQKAQSWACQKKPTRQDLCHVPSPGHVPAVGYPSGLSVI